jgi:hypothetical protein
MGIDGGMDGGIDGGIDGEIDEEVDRGIEGGFSERRQTKFCPNSVLLNYLDKQQQQLTSDCNFSCKLFHTQNKYCNIFRFLLTRTYFSSRKINHRGAQLYALILCLCLTSLLQPKHEVPDESHGVPAKEAAGHH